MKTLYLNSSQAEKAAQILERGGIVAIPTETVYGLAADAYNEKAILKIFEAKGRPPDNPLIVHIADINSIYDVVSEFPPKAQKLAEHFWPGPLTMILPKNPKIPDIVTAGMNSVAVRFPSHKIAVQIIKQARSALAAPSANISGKPSPSKFEHVVQDLSGKVDAMVDGGDCDVGVESTVVSMLGSVPKILRPGAVTAQDIKNVLGEVDVDKAVYEKINPGEKVLSPGMKYKHYSPVADVTVVKGTCKAYADFVNSKASCGIIAMCFDEDIPFLKIPYISYGSMNEPRIQASALFGVLRSADKAGAATVYAHFFGSGGMSAAVYNRLIRAAGFKVLEI